MTGEQGDVLLPGDIVQLNGGHCTLFKGSLTLNSGIKRGMIERVGQYRMIFRESPNMSTAKWDLDNTRMVSTSLTFKESTTDRSLEGYAIEVKSRQDPFL